jgi:alpha-amylase
MSLFSRRNLGRAIAVLGAVALTVSVASGPSLATPIKGAHSTVVPAPNKTITTQSVGIQMFMWPWASLQTECTDVLGPSKVDWIMVSPPQEDVTGNQWWTHYQPVSYQLSSQLGSEQEFTDMVSACNTAGVQVIVDAVINHMANSSGTGFGGSRFTKYNYPGIYTSTDFHSGLPQNDANYCARSIRNYNDNWDASHCELGGLPDLATEKPTVRETIAAYLNHLLDLGVSGFRIDAAKHIGLTDLTAIHQMLNQVNGKAPYFLQESIGNAAYNQPWIANGDVFAWDYQDEFMNMFSVNQKYLAKTSQRAAEIGNADSTIIMVSNHDTEHHGPTAITYMEPKKYLAASAFLLADSLGKPMLYTGYAFDVTDQDSGPPTFNNGLVAPAVCPSGSKANIPQKSYRVGMFICMDRWTGIKGMIAWHHAAGTNPMTNLSFSKNVLSFNRGKAFFAVNANETGKAGSLKVVKTGLPKGTYCDMVTGGAVAKGKVKGKLACLGTSIVVASNGTTKLSIPAMTSIAVTAATKLK